MGRPVKRVVVRIFLPLEMGAAGRIMQAVADAFPGAAIGDSEDTKIVDLVVDDPEPTPETVEPGA